MQTVKTHFLSDRRYDIDAIRVLAFGILIFYHVAMFYVTDWGWHIKSQYQYDWLQQPMMFVNQWRMALLFVISGMATAILIHKFEVSSIPGFAGSRMRKLGLPLLFGIFVIVVPQAYFEAKANGAFNEGYLAFWFNYVTFGEWQQDAFGGSDFGFTWNHLWYLPYIIFYTLVTVAMRFLMKRIFPAFNAGVDSGDLWRWYAVMLGVLMCAGLFVFPLFPERTHALFDDWYTHSLYFSFFALGYFLIRSEQIWYSLRKNKWLLLGTGVFSYIAFRLVTHRLAMDNLGDDSRGLLEFGQLLFIYLNRISWILVVLAFAFSYLNKNSVTLRYCNKAVFSWYILHQTITVVIGAWLSPLNLGGGLESGLVLAGTIFGCLVIHHFVVIRFSILHPVFGYQMDKKTDSVHAQPTGNTESTTNGATPINS